MSLHTRHYWLYRFGLWLLDRSEWHELNTDVEPIRRWMDRKWWLMRSDERALVNAGWQGAQT